MIIRTKKYFNHLLFLSLLLLSGCSDWFEYHPYDGRVHGETFINNKNIKRIAAQCAGKDTLRFVFVSDTQRCYDETQDFVDLINKRTDVDFVIHGGDISDFGLTKEFMWMRDIMNHLKVPYVVLLGNHDCLGNGKDIFRRIFGDENFSFMAGNTQFVCLNTNAIEFDYSVPVPDFEFIENQIKAEIPDREKTVVVMHAPPYNEQFNNNVARVFERYINEFPQLQFCLFGHIHNVTASDIFEDGTMYYSTANIEKKVYMLFTLTPDGYTYETIYF